MLLESELVARRFSNFLQVIRNFQQLQSSLTLGNPWPYLWWNLQSHCRSDVSPYWHVNFGAHEIDYCILRGWQIQLQGKEWGRRKFGGKLENRPDMEMKVENALLQQRTWKTDSFNIHIYISFMSAVEKFSTFTWMSCLGPTRINFVELQSSQGSPFRLPVLDCSFRRKFIEFSRIFTRCLKYLRRAS